MKFEKRGTTITKFIVPGGRGRVWIFVDDMYHEFNLSYCVTFDKNNSLSGLCSSNLRPTIRAFNASSFEELAAYLTGKYADDADAWHHIIEEMKDLGLKHTVNEFKEVDGVECLISKCEPN